MLIQIYNLFSGFLLLRTPSLQMSDEPNVRTLELTHVLGTVSEKTPFLSLAFSLISKVLFGLTTSSVAFLIERQPHRAPFSLPVGEKPQKVGRFRSKTADFSSFLPLFFPQVHHFCSVMAIPDRGCRFFRRTAHRGESEKHRSPMLVGGLRRGRVSDLAFHVKRFTPIHLARTLRVDKEERDGVFPCRRRGQ